jgi:hypothetical protein
MPVPLRIVSTLCSKRSQPSDCVDISGTIRPRVTLSCGATRLPSPLHPTNTDPTDRFPPNTRGFFYYHTPPKAPPFVGELRFRCASNLDDFHNGKDLLSKDKFTPWSIPQYVLANYITYATWREQLILDNLVTQATLDKWLTAQKAVDRPVLYYFTQPFFFRFNSRFLAFYMATKDEIGDCMWRSLIIDSRVSRYRSRIFPYGGELSSWI